MYRVSQFVIGLKNKVEITTLVIAYYFIILKSYNIDLSFKPGIIYLLPLSIVSVDVLIWKYSLKKNGFQNYRLQYIFILHIHQQLFASILRASQYSDHHHGLFSKFKSIDLLLLRKISYMNYGVVL